MGSLKIRPIQPMLKQSMLFTGKVAHPHRSLCSQVYLVSGQHLLASTSLLNFNTFNFSRDLLLQGLLQSSCWGHLPQLFDAAK